ncbi:MAG TPA: hypothetical protein VEC06_20205 [Paucimonas sp.]|nr:hypothetical protein [Paucimonas sp.]
MNESMHLYVTGRRVLARRKSGVLRWQRVEPAGEWAWDTANPASLRFGEPDAAGKGRRTDLHVYVGSALSKFLVLDLPAGLRDRDESRAAAQAQIQHQLGLHGADWVFALDLAPAPAKSVVCAVPRDFMERIRELARERNLRLVSLRPYVSGVWNAFRQDDASAHPVLMAVEEDAFTLLVARQGVLQSMSSLRHGRESDLIEREIKRVELSVGADARRHIRLALPPDLLAMAGTNADKLLRQADGTKSGLHADFRDLLFAAAVDTAAEESAE